MGSVSLDEISVSTLDRIPVLGGDVLKALTKTDYGFIEFGEAYFSKVNFGAIKAWKMHHKMTLNLIVPLGQVNFVFFVEGGEQKRMIMAGDNNYVRVTVPPGIWFGFQGAGTPVSLVLNIANITHDPNEVERKALNEIPYDWSELL